jgi:DNA-binding CsgD family transcriptional regulator
VAVLDGLGAAPVAALTRRRLRTAAVLQVPRGPKTATRTDPAGPAGRRREILALVADGLTNAETAARLGLSAREDDHHASAVLTKLDVTTRRKAAGGRHRLSPLS